MKQTIHELFLQFEGNVVFTGACQIKTIRSNQFESPLQGKVNGGNPSNIEAGLRHTVGAREEAGVHARAGRGKHRSRCSSAICMAHRRARLRVQNRRLLSSPTIKPPSGKGITSRLAALALAWPIRLAIKV